MPKKRPTVGDIVEIVFLDHAENSKDVLLFEVYGRLIKITSKGYLVKSWGYVREVDQAADSNTDNENWYAIVKKAVQSIRVLK